MFFRERRSRDIESVLYCETSYRTVHIKYTPPHECANPHPRSNCVSYVQVCMVQFFCEKSIPKQRFVSGQRPHNFRGECGWTPNIKSQTEPALYWVCDSCWHQQQAHGYIGVRMSVTLQKGSSHSAMCAYICIILWSGLVTCHLFTYMHWMAERGSYIFHHDQDVSRWTRTCSNKQYLYLQTQFKFTIKLKLIVQAHSDTSMVNVKKFINM